MLVPASWDEGEIEGPDGPIEVQLLDLCDEVTIVGTPKDTPREQIDRLMELLGKQRIAGKREFIVMVGRIPEEWEIVRLIPRDQYDPVLRERRLDG